MFKSRNSSFIARSPLLQFESVRDPLIFFMVLACSVLGPSAFIWERQTHWRRMISCSEIEIDTLETCIKQKWHRLRPDLALHSPMFKVQPFEKGSSRSFSSSDGKWFRFLGSLSCDEHVSNAFRLPLLGCMNLWDSCYCCNQNPLMSVWPNMSVKQFSVCCSSCCLALAIVRWCLLYKTTPCVMRRFMPDNLILGKMKMIRFVPNFLNLRQFPVVGHFWNSIRMADLTVQETFRKSVLSFFKTGFFLACVA
jgi:hypothetical protein